ncbi:MAG: glycosyltransferase family 9 protein, partial [Nanoarchaeota archaeon]|nr:glycosyltransferase family 9 protein [Nanoarchaeota archaeon]
MGIKLIKAIDRVIGTPLCLALAPFKRNKAFSTDKVLFIQLWGIGETVLTFPAIHAFKNKYPDSNITVLCTERNKEVYYQNSDINHLEIISLSPISILKFMIKHRFDLVIDFEEYLNISSIIAFFTGKFKIGYKGRIRSKTYNKTATYNDQQHVVETHLDLVRLLSADDKPEQLIKLKYSAEDKIAAEAVIKSIGISDKDTIIGFGAGTAESARSRIWPYFRELAQKLPGKKLVFFGTEEEKGSINLIIKGIDNAFNLAGKLTLRQAFAAIERCNLFISNDTGTMHIAATQGVKTIGLFGPNIPTRWAPFGKGNVSIYKGEICKYSPCIN